MIDEIIKSSKIPLWQHQKDIATKAFHMAISPKPEGFGLFMEMGTGKTLTMITVLRGIANYHKRLPRILIFGPPIVLEKWKSDLLKSTNLTDKQITCLYGPGKKRVENFTARGGLAGHIFITNYQSLLMPDLFRAFETWQPEIVIFDESHYLKNYKSSTAKLAEKLVNGNMKLVGPKYNKVYEGPRPLVYELTGSPILNSMLDLFQQYKILDAGGTFGLNFFHYRAQYFRDKNAGMSRQNHFPNWVPMPGAQDQISALIKRNSVHVRKADCLDLPPLIRKVVKVPMTPAQREVYNSMMQNYVAVFQTGTKEQVAAATMAMTKDLRLMQIASGYIKNVEGQEVSVVAEGWNPKQEALHEILEQIISEHKVVIWATWKKNYEHIREVLNRLGVNWVEVHGEVSDKDKFAAVERFNTDDTCRVLFGNPISGGIGIDLVPASYSIFYSRDYSLGKDMQAEARNYRGGSEIHEKITRIDLVCEKSIEEKVAEKLANKQSISEAVMKEITLELEGE